MNNITPDTQMFCEKNAAAILRLALNALEKSEKWEDYEIGETEVTCEYSEGFRMLTNLLFHMGICFSVTELKDKVKLTFWKYQGDRYER